MSRNIILPTTWRTARLVLDATAQEITVPSGFKGLVTVRIQAKKTNIGLVYGADASDVDAGTNAGFELQSGQSTVEPLSLSRDNSHLFIKGLSGDIVYISYYDGADLC